MIRRRSPGSIAIALLTAGAFTVAACGGSDEGAPTTVLRPTTTTAAAATTTTVARTTTTAAPTTTTEKPKPKPKPVYPLTGLGDPDKEIMKQPALVVKIDNASGARPQTGFNSADIVYEEIVNDALTRFAMVFHSQGSNPVGPIRSGRLQDIDLFGAYIGPLFAWSGGNATVTAAIRASDLVELGPSSVASSAYFRSSDRYAPHNLYSSTDALRAFTPPEAGPPPPQFGYRTKRATKMGVASPGVGIALDSVDVQWNWDPERQLYLRTMEGSPHIDRATGEQVSTDNVVVLVMDYHTGISNSPDAQSLGNGEAHIFTGGRYIHGTWSRLNRLRPFIIRDEDQNRVRLTPGRTFIELPRFDSTLPLLED